MRGLPHIMPLLWVHGEDEATCRKMAGVIYDANPRAFCGQFLPVILRAGLLAMPVLPVLSVILPAS